MLKRIFPLMIILGLGSFFPAQAQLKLFPNYTNYKKTTPAPPPKNEIRIAARSSVLDLPFFDDFSTLELDTTRWIDTTGAFINNQFGFEPISLGVATLDGTNADGDPYDFSTVVSDAIGQADVLTSCPIRLGSLTSADNVYLSFYWQQEGFGEVPDATDSLQLQFKNQADEWITVWSTSGGNFPIDTLITTDTTVTSDTTIIDIDTLLIERTDIFLPFQQQFVQVTSAQFFFDDFQFRFRSVGRLSGLYDAWHVDYVFMNQDINPDTFFTEEIACSQDPEYFLRNYTAMPLNQYLVAPFRETNFSYSTTLNNLSDPATQDAPSFTFTIENFGDTLLNQERPNFILDGDAQNRPIVENSLDSTFLADNILPVLSANPDQAQQITSIFNVSTQDSDALFGPNADFRINDTIRRVTELSDFYAYDDGSAEFGIGINQRFGQVAIRFVANESDTITDVLFHLTKLERDLTGITFNLVIWQDINNVTGDSVLFKVNVPVRYAEERNGFLSIKDITKLVVGDSDTIFRFEPTIVSGVFYIGWEQTTNDRLTMGFDRNNDSTSDIFFNIGDRWESFEVAPDDSLRQKETGSIMFRPVFGQASNVVTSVEELPEPEIKIFPNPANKRFVIEGEIPEIIQIYDLYGRLIQTENISRASDQVDLMVRDLASGTYILKGFYANGQQIFRRIVVQH